MGGRQAPGRKDLEGKFKGRVFETLFGVQRPTEVQALGSRGELQNQHFGVGLTDDPSLAGAHMARQPRGVVLGTEGGPSP
eukprot:5765517-Alexandrium_andersonii.AAC.1